MAIGEAPASITACVGYFAQQGREVDRSTISRFVSKHSLAIGTKGRAVLVIPADVYRLYMLDYTRATMAGEASGATQARTPTRLSAVPRAPAPDNDATAFAITGADVIPPNDDDNPAKALKRQQLRRAARENAEAEGALTPTVEVAAAMAAAIAEFRAITTASIRQFTEECVAEFDVPTDQRAALQKKTAAMLRAGQNAFARNMAELVDRLDAGVPAVQALLEELAELAGDRLAQLNLGTGEDDVNAA